MTTEIEKTPPSDMPFFRMTDKATGITGMLKVERDSNGNWMIPDPELRKKFAQSAVQSLGDTP